MNKKTGIVLVLLLATSLIANVFAYKPKMDGPAVGQYEELKEASIIVGIKKNGEVNFVSPLGGEFNRIRVGEERPIQIAKHLPGKVIKTLDNIVIFSGSPVCTWHDGWIICERDTPS